MNDFNFWDTFFSHYETCHKRCHCYTTGLSTNLVVAALVTFGALAVTFHSVFLRRRCQLSSKLLPLHFWQHRLQTQQPQQLGAALPICFQQTSSRVSVNPCTADRSKTGNGTHTASSGKLLKLTLTLPFKKWINFCPRHSVKKKTFWMFLDLIHVVCPFRKVTFHTD